MTKLEFTQHIAENHKTFGLWSHTAKLALDTNRVDLYVDHWLEQEADPISRPSIKKMLGNRLYRILLIFKTK